MRLHQLVILALVALLSACQTSYVPTGRTYNRLTVDSTTAQTDTSMARFLQPYRQALDKTMNQVLVRSTIALEKQSPESALNNMLADALRQAASQRYGKPVDVAHLNFYGIRSGLPQGAIRIGNIYEVMPFDNQITILTLNGSQLLQLLNHFAKTEPLVVSGVRVTIRDKKVEAITLTNGKPLSSDQTYTVAVSDYVANGGSDAGFLSAALKREDLTYFIRDAFIEYFRKLGQPGQPISPTTDGRISIQ